MYTTKQRWNFPQRRANAVNHLNFIIHTSENKSHRAFLLSSKLKSPNIVVFRKKITATFLTNSKLGKIFHITNELFRLILFKFIRKCISLESVCFVNGMGMLRWKLGSFLAWSQSRPRGGNSEHRLSLLLSVLLCRRQELPAHSMEMGLALNSNV